MSRTVAEAIRAGAAQLKAAGIDGSDARVLLAGAMGVARERLLIMGPDAVPEAAEAAFTAALARRAAREPVSKILGRRAFWGRAFIVTPDVLDPRPETESLIAEALAGDVPGRVLDLGTGSGCIVVTLLAEWPQAVGVAVDLSDAALDVAGRNAAALGVAERLELIRSDWFSAVEGRFDLIVSNPPYISEAEMAGLSPEVRGHDPLMALSPGGDGLAPYRIIAAQAAGYLTQGGRLMVEIGWQQGADVARIFADAGLVDVRVLPDLDGRDRVVVARHG
ncbi:peptide chain release factor N(5)-glutamine methyltransferase [Thalassovita taeanensis]|uniref:Release factor glutamine methyltransferase n=1 Tax=Thalassovita taeanensis TaxID=657014 RepID=A0A1H8YYX5_9RHOB|nr:peptide chain release factor N(5)-glutamine methyltransferase [Thalassovita taeanensis]SEP57409.1 [protein release factor]-glutamine N5-methyltransferase [Thalassovita taeanensis]